MRDLHEQMLAAVIDGEGLGGIAELAAHEVGGPVAIVLPARGLGAIWPRDAAVDRDELATWSAAAAGGETEPAPEGVERSAPIVMADAEIGRVVALGPGRYGPVQIDHEEVLRAAALAVLAELAVLEARDQLAEQLRGSFIEDLRAGGIEAAEVVRRGKRLGCELSSGGVALAAEASGGKPRYMAAIVSSVAETVIAETLGDRVFAVLPNEADSPGGEIAQQRAREVIRRLRPHGPAVASSYHADPAELGRALEEAELMLEVVARSPGVAEQVEGGIPDGVYRLLLRALASDPGEVMRFYADTVAVLVDHDREYRTDLLGTVEAYLAHDCNMRATAEAVYAHRHTIAHRLERVSELCGLDPSSGEDRERLGLGIKAYRLIEPTLRR